MILSGPHSLIQTIYDDQLLALEAVVIDEATGKIAVCSSEEVHIYKPYGKKEGALKVGPEMHDRLPSREVLTKLIVGISVLFAGSKSQQWYIDTFMGLRRRASDWIFLSEIVPDCGRRCFGLESQSP